MTSSQLLLSLIPIGQFCAFVSLDLSKIITDWFYIISHTVPFWDGPSTPGYPSKFPAVCKQDALNLKEEDVRYRWLQVRTAVLPDLRRSSSLLFIHQYSE